MLRIDGIGICEEAKNAVLEFISRPTSNGTVKSKDATRLVRVATGYWEPIRKSKTVKSNLTITRL